MNIFFVSGVNNGCAKWRGQIPAKYLQRRGHKVHFYTNKEDADCPDAIVFSRSYQDHMLRLFHWCKDHNIRTVYDTDDALDLIDPWNPAYATVRQHQDVAKFMLTHADVVTTTTPTLAEHLKTWNSNVAVIPNSVDPEEWKIHPRKGSGLLRVGWTGGSTHFLDLALVLDTLAEMQKRVKFTFVIQGLTSEGSVEELYRGGVKRHGNPFINSPLGRSIKVFLRKTSSLPYEFHPSVPTPQHASMVSELALDIGIAPLTDTRFNRHKSCIKYYEYAMSGAVTIASDVLPYSAEVTNTCRNTRDGWKQQLSTLMDSDLSALWARQYEWVMTHRNMEQNVGLWEQVLSGRPS
jgi:glycosyltransferase involved in cell wall biosynthesis